MNYLINKLLPVLLILGLVISCKDVEKNPSSCDYETIESDGVCMKGKYKAKIMLAQLNEQIFETNFIRKHFTINDNNRIVFNRVAYLETLNSSEKPPVLTYFEQEQIIKKYLVVLKQNIEQLHEIDDDVAWDMSNKLENLRWVIQSEINLKAPTWIDKNFNNWPSTQQEGYLAEYIAFVNELGESEDANYFSIEKFVNDEINQSNTFELVTYLPDSEEGEEALINIRNKTAKRVDCLGSSFQACIDQIKESSKIRYPLLYNNFFNFL